MKSGEENSLKPDAAVLQQLVIMKMPFGKYKGTLLCDLPVYYLEWFYGKGFPQGKLGMLLHTIYVIKTNGLMDLLRPLRTNIHGQKSSQKNSRP